MDDDNDKRQDSTCCSDELSRKNTSASLLSVSLLSIFIHGKTYLDLNLALGLANGEGN